MSKLFLQVCHAIDLWLLLKIGEAVEFVVEWTGVRRVRAERTLLIAYAVCYSLWIIARGRWNLLLLVFPALSLWAMWDLPQDSGQQRLMRMLTRTGSRLCGVFLTGVFCAMYFFPPMQRSWVLLVAAMFSIATFEYAIAMPNSGEPGRRKKVAIEKLKVMFGTSWTPEPEARPS